MQMLFTSYFTPSRLTYKLCLTSLPSCMLHFISLEIWPYLCTDSSCQLYTQYPGFLFVCMLQCRQPKHKSSEDSKNYSDISSLVNSQHIPYILITPDNQCYETSLIPVPLISKQLICKYNHVNSKAHCILMVSV